MVAHVRQIDSSIKLDYDRNPSGNYSYNSILNFFNNKEYDKAIEEMIKKNINYCIWYSDKLINETDKVKVVISCQNYIVYEIISTK